MNSSIKRTLLATAWIFVTAGLVQGAPAAKPSYVKLAHQGAFPGKFEVTWQQAGQGGKKRVNKSWSSGSQKSGYAYTLNLPADATNVQITGWAATPMPWIPWKEANIVVELGPTNKTYTLAGVQASPKLTVSGPTR